MRWAGIVLAGGRATRMGHDKAWLPWHGSTLSFRVAALLVRAVDGPVIVVAAPAQELPELPAGVEVARDAVEGRGPGPGFAAGLEALAGRADALFLAAVDLPLLRPAFVRAVLGWLGEADAAVPTVGGVLQPLAAAYRPPADDLAAALAGGRLSPTALVRSSNARLIDEAALRGVDPVLGSLRDLDAVGEYERALAEPQPLVEIVVDGAIRSAPRAATLGLAVDAALLARAYRIAIAGADVPADPRLPLVSGDRVEVETVRSGA